jgi:hypothetical protein
MERAVSSGILRSHRDKRMTHALARKLGFLPKISLLLADRKPSFFVARIH